MKIPLEISKTRIVAESSIMTQTHGRGLSTIEFIVDTGSPETFIAEGDALRMNLPTSSLKTLRNVRMGGASFQLKGPLKVRLILKDSEDKRKMLTLTVPVAKSNREEIISKTFPSIMGMDFLEQLKFALYVNPSKRVAYLEQD